MIIVFGGNKCSGKSTTIANVAAFLSDYQSVCVVDADKQMSFTKWHNRRVKYNRKIKFNIKQAYGNLAEELFELDKNYDLVFLDVAGVNSKEFISSLGVAHLVFIPLEPTIKILETLEEFIIQKNAVNQINPNLKVAFGQVKTKISFSSSKRREFLTEHLSNIPFGVLFETIIFDRDSFFVSDETGGTVFDTKDTKAQSEIVALAKEMVEFIND